MSVMNETIEMCSESPSIYKIRFMPSELMSIFNDILANVTVSEVNEWFCKYVTTNIEPVGWRALWRTNHSNGLSIKYDFEVEVMDVLHNSLEAIAVVLSLISPKETELTAEQFDEKEKLLKEMKIVNIPLIQLYVISDDDIYEQYLRSAQIIEEIRFFYTHLWRPWDELANNDCARNEIFVDSKLQPRLELLFDMKDKTIPQSTINKINNMLSESWIIKNKIDSINISNNGTENNDNEEYINENDLLEGLRLKLRLDDIEREMKLLEDKHMRIIASNLKSNANNCYDTEEDLNLNHINKIHLIAKCFTLKLLNETLATLSTSNESEIAIEIHKSFINALYSAKSGDKIYLMPGIYRCSTLPWIENDIEIYGFGDSRDKIVLQTNDSVGDVFLSCNSSKLLFSGITLQSTSEIQSLVMIHSGFVSFNNCVLDGFNGTRNTIIVLSKAKVQIDNCDVRYQRGDGIVCKQGSVVINNGIDISNISTII